MGEKAAGHMHLIDGFSIVAMYENTPVGLISTYWKYLPVPLDQDFDAYIDILEVHRDFRRRGIARHLIELSIQRAQQAGRFQIRAWSSEDKTEAIQLWKALGFGLCPATTHPGQQAVPGYFVVKVI